jgi:hypothetical protein
MMPATVLAVMNTSPRNNAGTQCDPAAAAAAGVGLGLEACVELALLLVVLCDCAMLPGLLLLLAA